MISEFIRHEKMLIEEDIVCYCEKPCKILKSCTSSNPNRKSYRCAVSSCDLFWANELRFCSYGGGPCKALTSKVAVARR